MKLLAPNDKPKGAGPLTNRVFRALWIAALVGNTGTWMQSVGAQWLLVNQPHAAILVSLVQTADMLPDFLFSYVGGVLADILDRRTILVSVQLSLVVAGLALTVLTYTGAMPPALLLIFTFLIGAGSAFYVPAYQAMIPDIVSRQEVPAASALAAINVNLARAVGPALAGLLIERAGVGACFAVNTATFLYFGVVALLFPAPQKARQRLPERFVAALHAGGRYVRHSGVVRRLFLRSAMFLVPASALWALLPLVASRALGLSVSGYGVLLAALGIGAIAGALGNRRIRELFSSNALLALSSIVYAGSLVIVVTVPIATLACLTLVIAGMAWVSVLSQMNSEVQLFLPAWVRARGLSVYQMVMFGALGGGSAAWGVVAGTVGLRLAFLIAAALLVAGAATIKVWPLISTKHLDRSSVVYWPDPHLVLEPEPEAGPIMIQTVYSISPENEEEFFKEMGWLHKTRLRTGAVDWALYREGESANRFVEVFIVPSWEEHLRQHEERGVVTDRDHDDRAKALSDPPPETLHLIAVQQ